MPVSCLVLSLFALAVVSAIVGALTRKKVLYWIALIFGVLTVLAGVWVVFTVSRMP